MNKFGKLMVLMLGLVLGLDFGGVVLESYMFGEFLGVFVSLFWGTMGTA